MYMRMKVKFFPGCVKRHNHAGRAGEVVVDISFPSGPGGFVKNGVKFAVKFEVDSKPLRNSKD